MGLFGINKDNCCSEIFSNNQADIRYKMIESNNCLLNSKIFKNYEDPISIN